MEVHRVYIDNDATVSIMYLDCFKKMGIDAARLQLCAPLQTFTRGEVQPEGTIQLPVRVGDYPHQNTAMVTFYVVDAPSPFNVILGRDCLILGLT